MDASARFERTFGSFFTKQNGHDRDLTQILHSAQIRTLSTGTVLLREGDICPAVPFVIEGVIRVFRSAENGREITLYRINPGESCILSSGCATGLASFPASAVVERDLTAAFLPLAGVEQLFGASAVFRNFVLAQYGARMADMIELVEEVAFRRVDERLRDWLGVKCISGVERILITHQELADHIGTSREVISRILKDWEERGALILARGEIRLKPGFRAMKL